MKKIKNTYSHGFRHGVILATSVALIILAFVCQADFNRMTKKPFTLIVNKASQNDKDKCHLDPNCQNVIEWAQIPTWGDK